MEENHYKGHTTVEAWKNIGAEKQVRRLNAFLEFSDSFFPRVLNHSAESFREPVQFSLPSSLNRIKVT